jgi:hypothetical protein
MFFEGTCGKCDEVVEYMCSKSNRDDERKHNSPDADPKSECDGKLTRVPFPRRFATKWCYTRGRKKSTFLGPSQNVYKTDATLARDRAETRTVSGPAYRGKKSKE